MAHPTQIGRYQVVAELGAGAMGSVYLARDIVLGRDVALKTCRLPELARPEELAGMRARLLQEARSAAAIAHPHVVAVYDVVEVDDVMGSVFIAMEYVPGSSLEERLSTGPLSAPEALVIFAQLADALDFVHQLGFVHRDIKPSNVLLDREGQVKLADFGIAQPRNQDEELDGSLFGTPQYMAPEQILGLRTDARTDVFACGVLLFEALSGRKPFEGRTVAEVARRTLSGELTAPEGLLFGVAPVLRRALAREPDDRFPTAGALLQAMRQALREDPDSTIVTTMGPPASSPPPVAPTARWLATALAGAAIAALVVGAMIHQRMAAAGETRAREVGYARLVSEGLARIDADDPQAAVVLFSTAQKLNQHSVEAKSLVALAQRRVAQAAAAAPAAERPSASVDRPAGLLVASAAPAPAAAARAGGANRATTGAAVLIVDVVSESPSGTLVIFRDSRQILRLPFDFYQPARWLRRRPTGGHRREEIIVEPGHAVLRVLLARRNEPGVIQELPLEFAAGDRHYLELRVPAAGKPALRLAARGALLPALKPEPSLDTPLSSAAGPSVGPRPAARRR